MYVIIKRENEEYPIPSSLNYPYELPYEFKIHEWPESICQESNGLESQRNSRSKTMQYFLNVMETVSNRKNWTARKWNHQDTEQKENWTKFDYKYKSYKKNRPEVIL